MIFTETSSAGAFIIDLERREDERGYLRAGVLPERVRRARPEAGDRAGERRLQPTRPGRCAGCTSSSRLRPRRSSCAARAARSSTSSSTCGPRARPISSTSRCELDAGQRPRALRARAVRARLPDAGRRHRDELLRRRVLHAGGRGRPALRRSAAGLDWPLPVAAISREGRRSGRSSTTIEPEHAAGGWRPRDHRRHGARGARGARDARSASASSAPASWARASTNQIVNSVPGMRWSAISNRHAERARRASSATRGSSRCAVDVAGRARRRRSRAAAPAVTDDPFLLCRSEQVDVICEVTGDGRVRRARRARGVRARQGRRADERRDRRHDRADPPGRTPSGTA